jgi:hypothetical protein
LTKAEQVGVVKLTSGNDSHRIEEGRPVLWQLGKQKNLWPHQKTLDQAQ